MSKRHAVPSARGYQRFADEIDPTRLAILRGALQATADEMDSVFKLTAFSPIIAEGTDRASGLYDGDDGGVVVQGRDSLPMFICNMQFTVQYVLATGMVLRPGDVIIVNDPYECGTHLMDVKIVAPFFWKDRREFFVANTGHWPDVGGAVPGGFSSRATEVYQEGVRIPPIKLYDRGEVNDGVLDLLMANMRVPEERRGDLDAQLNALNKGIERLGELYDRFGSETIRSGTRALADRCEASMRQSLRELSDGTYHFEDFLDNDGIADNRLVIRLAVTIADDEITFDFTGSSDRCLGPMNCPATNTQMAALVALKHMFPDMPISEGTFRPVRFVIPNDSFLNARFPSPVSGSAAEVSQRIIDTCFGAFEQIFGERAYAQSFSTSSNLTIGGFDPRSSKRYVMYVYLGGGLGGHCGGDGLSNGTAVHSTARIPPMEVYERMYPVRVRKYGLRKNSAGTGRFRGGCGTVIEFELLRGEAKASLVADRSTQGPRGIAGGKDGAPSRYRFIFSDGTEYVPPLRNKDQDVVLGAGDRIILETPGGGGYGLPLERDPDLIRSDLRNEYYDAETIDTHFGARA